MILRTRTIKIIDDYGRKKFMKELRSLSKELRGSQHDKIADIIVYIDILFVTKINMTRETVDLKLMYQESITIMEKINSKRPRAVLDILLEIHYYNLNYIKDLRNIA